MKKKDISLPHVLKEKIKQLPLPSLESMDVELYISCATLSAITFKANNKQITNATENVFKLFKSIFKLLINEQDIRKEENVLSIAI